MNPLDLPATTMSLEEAKGFYFFHRILDNTKGVYWSIVR